MKDIKSYIENVLQPKIQGDGGWIEFVSLEGNELTVVFRGECSKCLILDRCIAWISDEIKKDCKADVTINAVRKKPYFQDV